MPIIYSILQAHFIRERSCVGVDMTSKFFVMLENDEIFTYDNWDIPKPPGSATKT